MDTNKIYSIIGLCNRAGLIVTGAEICERYIRNKKVKLIIVAADAGKNTKKALKNICEYYKVTHEEFGSGEMLGKMTGNSNRTVVGIVDEGFKTEILKRMSIYRRELDE